MNYGTSAWEVGLRKVAAVKPGLIARARKAWQKGILLPKDQRPKFEVSGGVFGAPVQPKRPRVSGYLG